jgi:putative chaperone protein DnaJ
MKIKFEELKKQKLDNEVIINLFENIYDEMNNNNYNRIKLNEISIIESVGINEFEIELKNEPISINDIFIVSKNGQIIVTPNFITKIEKNKVTLSDARLKNKDEIFVTYKY